MRSFALIAGVLGLAGVGLGAFGAHGLRDVLDTRGTHPMWETAVLYHLVHAVAVLGVSLAPTQSKWLKWAALWWSVGILLFSGSLYALALGAPASVLWPVTPSGGAAFMAGWVCVLAHARTMSRDR